MKEAGQYVLRDASRATPAEIQDTLEQGEVVWFERCPIELPEEADLALLRDGLAGSLKAKNLSYHPESDSVPRFEVEAATMQRVESILRTHGHRVAGFLHRVLPDFVPGWRLGTTSFRPLEERGRNLKPHSSNELVHIDAGAYGATNGDRILRFFVNVHPTRDRVWHTKGSLRSLLTHHEALWSAARAGSRSVPLRKGPAGHAYSALVRAASAVHPLARVIDSSPYDRSMRRIHNYMKDDIEFQADVSRDAEIRFPPMSAWMVFTDGISHAVAEGQHAFVTTALIPLANCRHFELTPYGILAGAGGDCPC